MPVNFIPPVVIPYLAGALGAVIGGTFADIDLAPPIPLRHRSAWTHGPIIPLLLYGTVATVPYILFFAVGFLPAYILHLLADMLPKKWRGGALVSWYPLGAWRMPAVLSLAWLAMGVGVAGRVWWTLVGPMWPI